MRIRKLPLLLINLLVALLLCSGLSSKAEEQPSNEDEVTLIQLEDFYLGPNDNAAMISPNGEYVSFLKTQKEGELWLATKNTLYTPQLLLSSPKPIKEQRWAFTNKHIIYQQDNNGDENWHLYAIDIDTKEVRDLTPFENIQVRVIKQSAQMPPEEMVIAINNRRKDYHDYYIVNIVTGDLTLIQKNDQFNAIFVDNKYKPRLAGKYDEKGAYNFFKKENGIWKLFIKTSLEDGVSFLSFDESDRYLYLQDNRNKDTTALVVIDIDTGESRVLGNDPHADISKVYFNPVTGKPLGVKSIYAKERFFFLDEIFKKDISYLQGIKERNIDIPSMTLDKKYFVVEFENDTSYPEYYLFNTSTKTLIPLSFVNVKGKQLPLCPIKPVFIKSRDGLTLVSYLTLPCLYKEPEKGWSLIVLPHGGPQSRYTWGYNIVPQWLANRGYAVLNVNYRGSTGFGKKFLTAGYGQWGRKMQDDLTDAVHWAIDQGIANKDKVAIVGASYGGYAVLAGLTFTPDLYACGVDVSGISNVESRFDAIPEYWKPNKDRVKFTIGGDPDTKQGRSLLKQISPIFYTDQIKKPLFVAHGVRDSRINIEEASNLVKKLKGSVPIFYVTYPEEGHVFSKIENTITLFSMIEAFLAKYLGGKYLPLEETNLIKKSKYKVEVDI